MCPDFKDTYNPLRKVKYIFFLLVRCVLQLNFCYTLQNTTSSACGSLSDWTASWTIWQQVHRLGGPPTLLVTSFFCRDKAPRAGIGGILDAVSQNCNVCGNVIGLLYRIFISFEFQPVPCLCIAGWKVRLVTDLSLRSAGPSASHFYISGVTSFCIPVTRYEHVAFTFALNAWNLNLSFVKGMTRQKKIAGNLHLQERH
jgi:hypothetical protein